MSYVRIVVCVGLLCSEVNKSIVDCLFVILLLIMVGESGVVDV